MRIAGIDEAGRGPVIGPLVVAGVIIDESQEDELMAIGVKDSKLLTDLQRKRLYDIIVEKFEYFKIVCEPAEVDEAVLSQTSNLNQLELTKMAMIINKLSPDKVIIDAPSTNREAVIEYVQQFLKTKPKIVAEHKADLIYPVVSAASIIAKETREMLLEELRVKLNANFGSGYPADPITKGFLERNWQNPKFDSLFRKSWATYKNLAKGKQKSLGEF